MGMQAPEPTADAPLPTPPCPPPPRPHAPPQVILETTGLADPAPVAFTFFANPWIASRFRLDSIVCVVDTRYVLQVGGVGAGRVVVGGWVRGRRRAWLAPRAAGLRPTSKQARVAAVTLH
jgi:hypothetical protein